MIGLLVWDIRGGSAMQHNKFFPEIHGNFGFGCMRLPMNGGQVDYDEFSKMADIHSI